MSSINYLDKTGLGTLWGKIKALIPTNVSSFTNDSGYITSASVTGLTDTTITTPATGQLLTYDSTSSKWVNTSCATTAEINEMCDALELSDVVIDNDDYTVEEGLT